MLDLAHIPFYAKDRGEDAPFIVAGGPCVCNAEPLADFFDLMMLGEGEVQLPDVCDTIIQGRREGLTKRAVSYTHLDVYKRQQGGAARGGHRNRQMPGRRRGRGALRVDS